MYRYEPSSLYPLAYRVVDTRYAVGDPRHIVTDNVSRARALAVLALCTAGTY